MFTGIIQNVGRVAVAENRGTSMSLRIETNYPQLELGESIAVNGACLTVAEFDRDSTLFFVSSETLNRSNLGELAADSRVNLERALGATDRLSGHIVQGHIDGRGELIHLAALGDPGPGHGPCDETAYDTYFRIPERLARYCVEKGSIAVNGVSLTINSITHNPDGPGVTLGFVLVPHTWKRTGFSFLSIGDSVNIEVDVLAKYVERLCQPLLASAAKN